MSNPYYDHTTYPSTGSSGSSAALRAELDLIEQGFEKLPALTGAANRQVFVKADESGLETREVSGASTAADTSFTPAGALSSTNVQAALQELDTEKVAKTDTIAINRGGTNLTTYAAGDIIYASAADTLAKLPKAAAGSVLLSGDAPFWGKVVLTTHVSGTLPVANGGTGATTFTSGGLLRGNGTGALTVASASDIVAAIGSTPVQNANSATTAGRAKPQRSDGVNWDLNWNDPGGQEFYVLGSSNGTTVRPCAMSGLSVNYAASANYANSAGSAATATLAGGGNTNSFFTAETTSEGQVGARKSGQNAAYLFNNDNGWGMHSASGGTAFLYSRATGKFTFNGDCSGRALPRRSDGAPIDFYYAEDASMYYLLGTTDGTTWKVVPKSVLPYAAAGAYAGINSNFDWVLVHNATIASNATLNVLSNYGYGIYYYTTSGTSGIFITCGNGAILGMSTEAMSVSVNAGDILSNSGSGSRTLSLYKLRKTA